MPYAVISGIDHRIESHNMGMRDLTDSVSTRLAAEGAGLGDSPVDVAELYAPFSHQEIVLTRALGLGKETNINPSGGVLAGNLMMASGLSRIGEVFNRIIAGDAGRGRCSRHFRSLPAAQSSYRSGESVMANLAAVVGIGQTSYTTKRDDVSIAGLVREAAVNALQDADLTWDDIDAVIIGKAPDMFEGVIMPEIYLTDALGCNGKPMMRVHTAGSVGGFTALVAASHVQSGTFKRVLTVAFEKQSNPMQCGPCLRHSRSQRT